MEYIPGYDEWKTTPPEYEEIEYRCPVCGYHADEQVYLQDNEVIGCDRCVKIKRIEDL